MEKKAKWGRDLYLSAVTETAGEVAAATMSTGLFSTAAGDATGAAGAGFWNLAWPARWDAKRPKIGFDCGGAISWNPSFGN